jgi:hypothetical protein
MRARALAASAVLLATCLAGCGGGGEEEPAADETISAEQYYAAMRVGDFEESSEETLDKLGQGFCSDLDNMEDGDLKGMTADEARASSVLVLRESVDTEAEAFQVGEAMTARFCPEFRHNFVLDD